MQCGLAAKAGRWRTIRVLAEHGWSRVYLAVDETGQEAALKELLFSVVPSASQLETFMREGDVLRALSHPNIPRFLESFEEGSGVNTRLYLAQEFVAGESLAEQIGKRSFTESEVRWLARQLLETLIYLHEQQPKIIHRDLKPSNLIVRADGTIALVDFGAARGVVDTTFRSTFTGTFGYAPVEQLGGTVDATSDLYALGASLIHVLSQKPPDELLGPDMALHFEQHVPVSSQLLRFLKGLVARDKRDRFPSAEAALRALNALSEVPARQGVSGPKVLLAAACAASIGLVLLRFSPDAPWSRHHPLQENRQAVVRPPVPPGPAGAMATPQPPTITIQPAEPEAPAVEVQWRAPKGHVIPFGFVSLRERRLRHTFVLTGVEAAVGLVKRDYDVHTQTRSIRHDDLDFFKVFIAFTDHEKQPQNIDWQHAALIQTASGRVVAPWDYELGRSDSSEYFAALPKEMSRAALNLPTAGRTSKPLDTIAPKEHAEAWLVFKVSQDDFPIKLQLADGATWSIDGKPQPRKKVTRPPRPTYPQRLMY